MYLLCSYADAAIAFMATHGGIEPDHDSATTPEHRIGSPLQNSSAGHFFIDARPQRW
jgi:hypothetical protein